MTLSVLEVLTRHGRIDQDDLAVCFVRRRRGGTRPRLRCKRSSDTSLDRCGGVLRVPGGDGQRRPHRAVSRETQVTSGNGTFKTSGLGSNQAAKEVLKVGFEKFKVNATRISASIKPGDRDYHLHGVELHNSGPTSAMTLAYFVALCSAVMVKPLQQQMVALSSVSLGGGIIPVENVAESLQVAFDSGAKRILLPMVCVEDIQTIPGKLFAKFQISFYGDPTDAVFKAPGVH